MSVSTNKEDLININDPLKNKESDNLIIKNIYPIAKLIARINKTNSENNEKRHDFYELNKEFLFALVQPTFILDKQKMLLTIGHIIKQSKLSQKIIEQLETEENMNTLSLAIAKNSSFMKIDRNNILYHVGEIDDKFYFIIKGRISQLNANIQNLKLSFEEYISYLLELQRKKEVHILNEVLTANNKEVEIKSVDDIKKIYNVIFKEKLIEKISLETITNNTELEDFFKQYYQDFGDYKLSKRELKKLEKDKNKIIMGAINRDWDDYILEKCHPNSDDLLLFEPFEEIYKSDKKNYICYIFEISSNLTEGDYFGDFSLDEDKIIRNETIRAEEDTVLGWISNEDYINIVAPSRKIEKQKEISLLNNSFFFKSISERIFKKNYYEMFVKKEYGMNTILFNSGEKPKSLIFLKQGKISLVLNCSIIELYNLIQMIYIQLNKVAWPYDNFQKKILVKEDLKTIEKKYFNEPILKKIKTFNKIFKFELEKKRKFQLSLFSDLEIIGLEEIYLKIPYIAKGIVIGDKIICNEIPLDKFNIILQEEIRNITESYVKASLNRVLSLMERLHNLKQNYMNIARIKSETASLENNIFNINNSFNNKILENKKNNFKNKFNTGNNSMKKNILNINNSKTLIPQNFEINKNSVCVANTENNDTEKKSNVNSRVNSTKLRTRRITSLKRGKNNRTFSSYRKISPKKMSNYLKSASKIRNTKLGLEKNEISARAGSVKLYINKKYKNKEKALNKSSDVIIIGNTKINIRKLKKKVDEYQTVDDIRRKYIEDENDLNGNLPILKDADYIKIEEQNKNETSFDKNKYKKINTIKANQTNIKHIHKNYISIKNSSECTFTNTKERYNSIDFNNQNKFIKKNNKKLLLINPISPMSIKPLNMRDIHNKKALPLNLNIERIKYDKKFIITNNTINNKILVNQSSNTYTNTNTSINNENTVSLILPNIQRKSKFTEYLLRTPNSNYIKNTFKKKISSEKIPEIVKNYYSKIKKRGYIPLIVNKESNTIFLRKYHKKYNDVENELENKSINKNGNILPRINDG